jgi:hypothetical protein
MDCELMVANCGLQKPFELFAMMEAAAADAAAIRERWSMS